MNDATAAEFDNVDPFYRLDYVVTYQMICIATTAFCDVSD